jgi:triosephosphate isomerase
VDETVAGDYAAEPSIDGLFVGRAALIASRFITIIDRFARAREHDSLPTGSGRTHP